jgi:DNA-binding CsgD family transcriptional regulator
MGIVSSSVSARSHNEDQQPPRTSRDWMVGILDDLHELIAVLDPDGSLHFANRAAREVLPLFTSEPVRALADRVRRDGRERRGVVVEADGGRWRGRFWLADEHRVAVMLHREVRRRTIVDRLAIGLGLDAAEARLALRVAEGRSDADIGELVGSSAGAVHGRVDQLLRKLGAHRRSEIAAQVACCLAAAEEENAG